MTDELESLAEAVREHLLPLLDDALEAAVERHRVAEGRGVDEFSFGTDAWSLPARQFKEHISQQQIPFKLSPEPGCVLVYGARRVRHHRVGRSEQDDIWSSFPNNAKGTGMEASRQMQLVFPGLETFSDESVGTAVVAYMANEVEGLCAAYLTTIDSVDESGRIASWRRVIRLWSRGGDESAQVVPPPVPAPTEGVPVRHGTRRERRDDAQE